MDIKLLKPRAKESTLLISRNGKAVFGFGNIDVMELIETDYSYSGVAMEITDWKKRFSGLELMDFDSITVNEKYDQLDFNGYKINGYGRQFDFLDCFKEEFTLIPGNLISAIKNVGLSCSTDYNRYFMQGIYFSENGDIVATDGRRLTVKKSPIQFHNLIVRPESFKPFKDKDVYVRYGEVTRGNSKEVIKYLKLSDGEHTVISCPIIDQFPNYNRCVPTSDNLEEHLITGMQTFKKQEKVYKSKMSSKVIIRKDGIYKPEDENSPELKFGILNGFDKDEVAFNGEYLKDIFTQFGDKTNLYLPINTNCPKEECYGKYKSHMFGNISDYFTVVMPLQ